MKNILTLFIALLSFVVVHAQTQNHSIVIDESSFAPVQTDVMSGVAIDKIGKDTSQRPCARVKIHINRMTRAEIEELSVRPKGGNVVVMKQMVAIDGNGLIIELTAKEPTRFYLHHEKYGDSNEVSLNLEGDKEYRLSAELNISYPIFINSNVVDAEVYIDENFVGRTNKNFTLTVKDIVPGKHDLKIQYGSVVQREEIEVTSDNLDFRIDVNVVESHPQLVEFRVTPNDATVVVDNKSYPSYDNKGRWVMTLPAGMYNYRISADYYHEEKGTFVVADVPFTKDISLKPAHGWVAVESTTTLEGASVYIDNVYIGKVPVKSDLLASGEHQMRIVRDMYLPYEATITVKDNETLKLKPALSPNFANVTITTAIGADIYVDGSYKATTTWTGVLKSGTYKFEARKKNHRPASITKNIIAYPQDQKIIISSPTPITGSLSVESTPDGATVMVDGKKFGTTPLTNALIIGTHQVTISKLGYKDDVREIVVKENETIALVSNLELDIRPAVLNIDGSPKAANVYINDKHVGKTPLKHLTDAGEYHLKVSKSGYFAHTSDIVVASGEERDINFSLLPTKCTNVKNALHNMFIDNLYPTIGFSLGWGLVFNSFTETDLIYGDEHQATGYMSRSSYSILMRLWDIIDCRFNLTTGVQATTYNAKFGFVSIPTLLDINLSDDYDDIPYVSIGTEFMHPKDIIGQPLVLRFGVVSYYNWDYNWDFSLCGKFYPKVTDSNYKYQYEGHIFELEAKFMIFF